MEGMQQKKDTHLFPENVQIPENLSIKFVPLSSPFMLEAAKLAVQNEFKNMTVTSSVIVKDGQIIGKGINGDGYHQKTGKCERAHLPAGEGYHLCPGCHPDNHSERIAIQKAIQNGNQNKLKGAVLYLYGHWWSCETCMNAVKDAGITTIYLLEDAKNFFDRNNPNTIQKRQTLENKIKEILTN